MKRKDVELQVTFLNEALGKFGSEDRYKLDCFAPRCYALHKLLKGGCVSTEYTGTLAEVNAFVVGARWAIQNRVGLCN